MTTEQTITQQNYGSKTIPNAKGVTLEFCDFFQSHIQNISNCEFHACDFTEANLSGATIVDTLFDGCDFTNTDFRNATFRNCTFLRSFFKVKVRGVKLEGCVFDQVHGNAPA